MRHVLVDQPSVFGQLTDDFETKWITGVRVDQVAIEQAVVIDA